MAKKIPAPKLRENEAEVGSLFFLGARYGWPLALTPDCILTGGGDMFGAMESEVAYFDRIAADYDRLYQTAHDKAENWLLRQILDKKDLLNPHRSVIDVGAGTGFFCELRGGSQNVLSFEPSEGMRARLWQKFPAAPMNSAPAEDLADACLGRYALRQGLVSFYGPYNYAPLSALKQIPEVLRPGSPICLVGYGPSWTYLPNPDDPPRLTRWNPWSLVTVLQSMPLENVRVSGYGSTFFRRLPAFAPLHTILALELQFLPLRFARYIVVTANTR